MIAQSSLHSRPWVPRSTLRDTITLKTDACHRSHAWQIRQASHRCSSNQSHGCRPQLACSRFSVGSVKRLGDLAILKAKRKDDLEPYWQDEKDWLCIVEFLPTDDPEARLFAAEIIGYLVGYANLTNTRSLALFGDPDASAYELLFSFSSPKEKTSSCTWSVQMRTWGRDFHSCSP